MSEFAVKNTNGKKLLNDIDTAVKESLKGVIMSNPNVIMLDFGRIVLVKNYVSMSQVKIVSGGGAGHEPAYAGYVGKGMLAAAIHGEIFTSPPSSEILRLVRELSVKNNRGTLFIIQNNAGERLHFGLASEKAKNEGLRVEVIIVDDDCYATKFWKGRRGLSGIILLQKIAGAMADADMELEDIVPFCQQAQKEMVSISVSLQSPTAVRSSLCVCARRARDTSVEVGPSLNGEPGTKKNLRTTNEVCRFLLSEITASYVPNHIELDPTIPIVVLVNNLGITTKMEELVFVQELLRCLYEMEIQVARVYSGRFVTSLDTAGFSVTIMRIFDDKVKEYLDAPCDVPAWGKTNQYELTPKLDRLICSKVKGETEPVPQIGPKLEQRESNMLMVTIQFAIDALISCEKQLNTIDLEFSDGDTGTRVRKGVEAIDIALMNKTLNLTYPFTLLQSISSIIEKNIEGSLGLIYSVFFEAASNVFRELPDTQLVTTKLWLAALKEGNAAVKRYTLTDAGNRTIYDPLYVCATLLEEALNRDLPVLDALDIAVSGTEEAAQETKRPFSKYPDPGAHTVAIWMRAAYEAVKCRWPYD